MSGIDGPEWFAAERRWLELPDAATVCVAHGRFVPCRKQGEHRTTSNPYWVKSVRDYQGSAIEGLTWEPAWPKGVDVSTLDGI